MRLIRGTNSRACHCSRSLLATAHWACTQVRKRERGNDIDIGVFFLFADDVDFTFYSSVLFSLFILFMYPFSLHPFIHPSIHPFPHPHPTEDGEPLDPRRPLCVPGDRGEGVSVSCIEWHPHKTILAVAHTDGCLKL